MPFRPFLSSFSVRNSAKSASAPRGQILKYIYKLLLILRLDSVWNSGPESGPYFNSSDKLACKSVSSTQLSIAPKTYGIECI